MNGGEHFRVALYGVERGVNGRDELLAQPHRLPFVLVERRGQILPDPSAIDDRQGH
jgi:hypothetical protein